MVNEKNTQRNKSSEELPIQQKAYTTVLELVQTVERMPRSHRFVLGDRMINLGYDLIEILTIIRYTKDKEDLLRRINLMLERLRLLLRLTADLKVISIKSYGNLTGMIDEVGMMVGGWIKSQKAKEQKSS